jgi:hypothetical protein
MLSGRTSQKANLLTILDPTDNLLNEHRYIMVPRLHLTDLSTQLRHFFPPPPPLDTALVFYFRRHFTVLTTHPRAFFSSPPPLCFV